MATSGTRWADNMYNVHLPNMITLMATYLRLVQSVTTPCTATAEITRIWFESRFRSVFCVHDLPSASRLKQKRQRR